MDKQPTLYLICGVPGSGKTTLAMDYLASGLVQAEHSADAYFYEQFDEYPNFEDLGNSVRYHQGQAHKQCQARTLHDLKAGMSVAVHNTSTNTKDVKTYQNIARQAKARLVVVSVENWHGGVDTKGVPEEVLERMEWNLLKRMKLRALNGIQMIEQRYKAR